MVCSCLTLSMPFWTRHRGFHENGPVATIHCAGFSDAGTTCPFELTIFPEFKGCPYILAVQPEPSEHAHNKTVVLNTRTHRTILYATLTNFARQLFTPGIIPRKSVSCRSFLYLARQSSQVIQPHDLKLAAFDLASFRCDVVAPSRSFCGGRFVRPILGVGLDLNFTQTRKAEENLLTIKSSH
jgi:hypothetical protein